MQTITIVDRLWLEPTLLGATLNYAEGPQGFHFRIGINHRSILECARALKQGACAWTVADGSFSFHGTDQELTLIFSGGKLPVERRIVLTGHDVALFRRAFGLFMEAVIPRLN